MNHLYSLRQRHMLRLLIISIVMCFFAGCPGTPVSDQTRYNHGYDAGYASKEYYWDGFDDSYYSLEYDAGTFPFYEVLSYDAGKWDGLWASYNDGYFDCYHYAFVIGFSEGYDATFDREDYLGFLDLDMHDEYDDGTWDDGYNDGFSEGRVFGAADYEEGFSYDWLASLLEYEAGLDLEFAEVAVGTVGSNYPRITIYVYGTDPSSKASEKKLEGIEEKQIDPLIEYLNFFYYDSPRGGPIINLTGTWLERIDRYLAAI